MITFKHILCPVDFSDTSNLALKHAEELAIQLGASLHLLHVYQFPAFNMPESDLATPVDLSLQDEYKTRLQEQLDQLVDQHRKDNLILTGSLVEGVPYAEIVGYAKEHDTDLIVMGTHGRSGFAHVLLGSVTERVVRSATKPVLSVPTAIEEAKTA